MQRGIFRLDVEISSTVLFSQLAKAFGTRKAVDIIQDEKESALVALETVQETGDGRHKVMGEC